MPKLNIERKNMITKSREELIYMLSFKGFTTDYLMTKDDETLENLYIEYIVLAEDYVWVKWLNYQWRWMNTLII